LNKIKKGLPEVCRR